MEIYSWNFVVDRQQKTFLLGFAPSFHYFIARKLMNCQIMLHTLFLIERANIFIQGHSSPVRNVINVRNYSLR